MPLNEIYNRVVPEFFARQGIEVGGSNQVAVRAPDVKAAHILAALDAGYGKSGDGAKLRAACEAEDIDFPQESSGISVGDYSKSAPVPGSEYFG